MDVLERIRPSKIKDIVGNKIQINYYIKVLSDVDFASKIVLLIGPSGCGKTLFSELVFKELDFDVLHINAGKDMFNIIRTFIVNRTITSFFVKKRKIVFIDNIDILMTTERNIVSSLEEIYGVLEEYKVFLVCTCKNQEEKKLLELRGKVEPIKINYPSIKDTFAYLSLCNDTYNLGLEDRNILALVQKYKGNIRDVVLSSFAHDEEYTIETTFKDLSQFEIIKKLMARKHTLPEIMSLMKDDITVVSFLLYENVPDELMTNYDCKSDLLAFYSKMNELYIQSCIVEEHMHIHIDWTLFDLLYIIRLLGVTLLMTEFKKKPATKDIKFRFSQALSKVSHRNIMNKKTVGMKEDNNNIGHFEMLMLADKNDKKSKCNFVNTYQKYFG